MKNSIKQAYIYRQSKSTCRWLNPFCLSSLIDLATFRQYKWCKNTGNVKYHLTAPSSPPAGYYMAPNWLLIRHQARKVMLRQMTEVSASIPGIFQLSLHTGSPVASFAEFYALNKSEYHCKMGQSICRMQISLLINTDSISKSCWDIIHYSQVSTVKRILDSVHITSDNKHRTSY